MHHPYPFYGHDSEMFGESDLIPNIIQFGAGSYEETREASIRDLEVGVAERYEREATGSAQAARA